MYRSFVVYEVLLVNYCLLLLGKYCPIQKFLLYTHPYHTHYCWRRSPFSNVCFCPLCQVLDGCSNLYSCFGLPFCSIALYVHFYASMICCLIIIALQYIWNDNASSSFLFLPSELLWLSDVFFGSMCISVHLFPISVKNVVDILTWITLNL